MGAFTGFGKAYLKYKKAKATTKAKEKMKTGKSTRSERLEFGKRDKDIKSVSPSQDVKKGNIKESIRKGKQHFYIKNIDEVNKHKKAISEGEKAKKKLKHMTETKRAFHIGDSIHPSDPASKNK